MRLTIVIPLFHDTPMEAFEETLASVLIYKPDGTEVLIANGTKYSDPWNTTTEGVRYINLGHLSNPVEILNEAVRQSKGEILHILYPGAEVSAHWAVSALPLFEQSKLGIVIPCVYDRRKPKRIFSLGIWYKPEGVLRTVRRSQWAEAANKIVVPHISAVFIRKKSLLQAGLFENNFIPQISYADAAMAMMQRGWQTAIDPHCRITVRPNYLPATSPFIWGRQVERLYFRWLDKQSTRWTLGKHFGSFCVDFWRHLPRFKAVQILTGRLSGLFLFGRISPYSRSLPEESSEEKQPDILSGIDFGKQKNDVSSLVKRVA